MGRYIVSEKTMKRVSKDALAAVGWLRAMERHEQADALANSLDDLLRQPMLTDDGVVVADDEVLLEEH